MTRSTINRLRRLVRLTEHIYDQRAREVAETTATHAALTATLSETCRYLDEDTLVHAIFPNLLTNRAVKIGRDLEKTNAELQLRTTVAAASRANVKGLEGKLNRNIASDLRDQNAKALEETIDRFVRKIATSLP